MKKAFIINICLLAVATITLLPVKVVADQEISPLPQEITRFYAEANFVAAFSTPRERTRLLQIRHSPLRKNLPERLEKADLLLRRLERKIYLPDSDVVTRRQQGLPIVFPNMSLIQEVNGENLDIKVKVVVWSLSPSENFRLISMYESSDEEGDLSPEDMISNRLPRTATTQIHRWTLKKGTWMKAGVNIVLIDM